MAYLPIDRKLFDHFLWDERRVFSRFEAWLDLIQLVSYTAGNTKIINGVVVEWGRGEYPISRSFLSDRWCWGPQKTRGFLALLKLKGQITLKSTSICTILKLCNYEYYNGQQPTEDNSDNQRTTSGQPEIKKIKKITKINKSNPNQSGDFIDQVIDQFIQAHGSYEILNRGKERAAAGKLLNKYKEKYPTVSSSEMLAGLRHYFDQCVNINDSWLKTNMSLPIIISKFNEINNILKNGGIKRDNGATPNEIASIIASKFASDRA